MSFSFEINGIYDKNTLEELNGTSINFFVKNQMSGKSQQLIKIILDGNQNSLICRLTKEIYLHFSQLYDFEVNEQQQISTSDVQLAQQFYQYLSNIQIEVIQQSLRLKLNMDTDNEQFNFIETTKLDKIRKDIFCQVLQQIYGQEIGYLSNSIESIKILFIEYFRVVLIKKFGGYKLNQKKQKQLILLQNGDIIISKFNNQKTIPLSTSRIIHFQQPRFYILQNLLLEQSLTQIVSEGTLDQNFDQNNQTNIYSQDQLIYQGDMQYGLLNGEGTIMNRQKQIIYKGNFVYNKKHGYGTILANQTYFYGQFNDDMMNGPYQKYNEQNGQIFYFYQNQLVNQQEYYQQSTYVIKSEKGVQNISKVLSNSEVSQSISSYQGFNMAIQGYKALNPGIWLFETQLDYFLDYFKNFFSFTKKDSNGQTVIFNTNETSNFISCDYDHLFYHNEKVYQELNQNIKDKKRKVFVMNSQRSHFLIMIEDNKQLYICDSLYCQNKNLEVAFNNLLKLEDRRCYVLNCTQQKNGFDCGIFALFYAIQFMKYDNLNMVEIEKKLNLRNPTQFRWQLKQFVKYNHDYILTNF